MNLSGARLQQIKLPSIRAQHCSGGITGNYNFPRSQNTELALYTTNLNPKMVHPFVG